MKIYHAKNLQLAVNLNCNVCARIDTHAGGDGGGGGSGWHFKLTLNRIPMPTMHMAEQFLIVPKPHASNCSNAKLFDPLETFSILCNSFGIVFVERAS